MNDMTLTNILMVAAVGIAPILAVQVQKWLEVFREQRGRKIWIFKTLMATRAANLSSDHVRALNMIDLEFRGKNISQSQIPGRLIWIIWPAFLKTMKICRFSGKNE